MVKRVGPAGQATAARTPGGGSTSLLGSCPSAPAAGASLPHGNPPCLRLGLMGAQGPHLELASSGSVCRPQRLLPSTQLLASSHSHAGS